MPLNGAGVFARLYNWVADAANNIKISSTRMDAEFDGIATALSSAIYKDGQQAFAANQPMGGFKLTGLGAGASSADSVRMSQIQSQIFQGRLTLTTATPYLSATVTSATTVYYTPAVGGYVSIYDGTIWTPTAFTELSQATTDSTKSPAVGSINSVYDMFLWSDSGTLRCTRGPKWTSATARGTGAGTTELTTVAGVLMNAVAITNGPGASRGVYVGTVELDSIGRVNMKFGGTGAAGGEACRLNVWNLYNRARLITNNFDNTNSWTYSTATARIKNNNNNNKIFFTCGVAGVVSYRAVSVTTLGMTGASAPSVIGAVTSVALDSTSAFVTGKSSANYLAAQGGQWLTNTAVLEDNAPIGSHYVAPLEYVENSTVTFYGDAAVSSAQQSTFSLSMEM